MSILEAIDVVENGKDDDGRYFRAWQALIDSGVVWKLQGWYGRTAAYLIEAGLCLPAYL